MRVISGSTNGVTTIMDEEPCPISLDDLTPGLPPTDSTNSNPLLNPAINTTLEPDLTNDLRHIRSDPIVTAAQVESDTPASPNEESQIDDLINDNLNTFSTEGKREQIRISSLNIDGLTDVRLGLLLSYMDLKKLDVLALQDTRLSQSESNRLA